MIKRVLRISCAALGLSLASQSGAATCQPSDLNGEYGFEISGAEFGESYHAVGILEFDGVQKIKMTYGRQTTIGIQELITGGGKVTVKANCAAVANVTIRQTGEKIRVDMIIVGSRLMLAISDETSVVSWSGTADKF
jgi:hypothetical protein